MAGCKSTLTGEDFYGAYDAQDNAKAHAKELGMDTVPSLNITYTEVRLCKDWRLSNPEYTEFSMRKHPQSQELRARHGERCWNVRGD